MNGRWQQLSATTYMYLKYFKITFHKYLQNNSKRNISKLANNTCNFEMFRTRINCDITLETFMVQVIMKCFNSNVCELCQKRASKMCHLELI